MILVLLSSMVPYILPHAWLGEHYPGYDFYMFKGMAWTLKLALLIYLYGIVCIFTKNYFPKLSSLCTEEVRAVITGYKSSWSRGKQLCPVFTYKVGDKEYSEALNEAKGTKILRNFTCRAANIIRVRRRFSVMFCSACCFFCSCI